MQTMAFTLVDFQDIGFSIYLNILLAGDTFHNLNLDAKLENINMLFLQKFQHNITN